MINLLGAASGQIEIFKLPRVFQLTIIVPGGHRKACQGANLGCERCIRAVGGNYRKAAPLFESGADSAVPR